jgi:hypothetical protein
MNLNQLMQPRTHAPAPKENGNSLGIFKSPINGEMVELIVLYRGNKKLRDMMQLSVIPVSWELKQGSKGRKAICGSCPHEKLGTCYAHDQGLASMQKAGLKGAYKPLPMADFLKRAKGKLIRFGRFGDLSVLPYEIVKAIADVSGGFTGYTNQWRSKFFDERFTNIFMLSTLGEKDAQAASRKFPKARQFQVIPTAAAYTNDLSKGVIMCPSENGYTCDECLLCDGKQARTGSPHIQIRAHGADYKGARINKLLSRDSIAIVNI